jgi:hypothetical protein
MLTGKYRFHISTPQGIWTQVPCDRKQTDSPLDQWDMGRMKWDCRLFTGLPPRQPTPSVVKPEGRPAASVKPGHESCVMKDQVGLSHCREEGLVMARDVAPLGERRGHNDQSHRGHQCSKITLTGKSWFHISTPRGFEPGSLVTGSKWVAHWTSQKWWEWSEIAGSLQYQQFTK